MSIIDTPVNTTLKLACLKSKGVTTIIRYYNFRNSNQLPEKRLLRPEAQAIAAAGLKLGAVFQQGQNSAPAFSDELGFKAGVRAFTYARDEIGQPTGSGIYFSVDFDASTTQTNSRIVPFSSPSSVPLKRRRPSIGSVVSIRATCPVHRR